MATRRSLMATRRSPVPMFTMATYFLQLCEAGVSGEQRPFFRSALARLFKDLEAMHRRSGAEPRRLRVRQLCDVVMAELGYANPPCSPSDLLDARAGIVERARPLVGTAPWILFHSWCDKYPARRRIIARYASWVPRWTPEWHRCFDGEFREHVFLLLLARTDPGSLLYALPMEALYLVVSALAWHQSCLTNDSPMLR